MSLPKVAAKIVFTGTKILGRAFAEAGRQAVRNAKYRPEGADNTDPAGAAGGAAGNSTQKLTSDLKMTMDEACLILNVKKDTPMEGVLKNYEHLFKANAPPEPPKAPETPAPQPTRASRAKQSKPVYSHYLQSKVYRALERIKAERTEEGEGGSGEAAEGAEGAGKEGEPATPEPPKEQPKSKELPGKGPTHNPNEPIQL
ncbi:mitochondrial import inner membrane translocase subunit TIM16 [Naganishia albida]|nr:mitochondrial import inner membrane translocase subunit TIM16 [Naganishia albida]